MLGPTKMIRAIIISVIVVSALLGLTAAGVYHMIQKRAPEVASGLAYELEEGLRDYYDDHQQFPSGDNQVVTLTLRGEPPAKNYLRGRRVVEIDDELCDTWRTPLAISFEGAEPRVRSAGPDKIHGNGDDIDSVRGREIFAEAPAEGEEAAR